MLNKAWFIAKIFLGLVVLASPEVALPNTTLSQPDATAAANKLGDDASGTVENALKAYDAGDFTSAASAFEGLLAQGAVNGHVYYDLGNTYHRLGRHGEAMAAYLAARRFLPRDPDVRANIRFVLKGIPDKLDVDMHEGVKGAFTFWVKPFTAREFAYSAAISAFIVAILLTLSIKLRPLRFWAFGTIALPLLSLCGYGLSQARDDAWGAISAKTASVRSGPGAKDGILFELREGAPFLVIASRGAEAYQIQLSDGKKGWVAVQDAKVFGDL